MTFHVLIDGNENQTIVTDLFHADYVREKMIRTRYLRLASRAEVIAEINMSLDDISVYILKNKKHVFPKLTLNF